MCRSWQPWLRIFYDCAEKEVIGSLLSRMDTVQTQLAIRRTCKLLIYCSIRLAEILLLSNQTFVTLVSIHFLTLKLPRRHTALE